MIVRTVKEEDAEGLYRMLCQLDEETEYMMYEPGERQRRTGGFEQLKEDIAGAAGFDCILAAESKDGEFAGFLWAERGRMNRIQHTAYIVVGIREAYRHQGIGSGFFKKLDEWAAANGIVRLELSVECENTAARSLYEKNGFRVEGTREKSMKVGGRLVDEYYMSKLMQ